MKSIRQFWFLMIPALFTACATTRDCPIETLMPAKISFEGAKSSIAICTSPHLFADAVAANPSAIFVPTDSLIANILYTLQYSWKEVPGYEETQFFLHIVEDTELPDDSNYDIIVWLDNLQIKSIYYGHQYSYFDWEAYQHVLYTARWLVLDKSGKELDAYTDRDLIVWRSGIRSSKSAAVEGLPNITDAWWDMGIAIAKSYAARIVPQWHSGMRHIYMINKYPELSQQAYIAMQRNGYARAFDIWENMLLSCRKRGQKMAKSQITFNMAIASEFQNELDQAIHWAERSHAYSKKKVAEKYLKILKERQIQSNKLDMQTIQ